MATQVKEPKAPRVPITELEQSAFCSSELPKTQPLEQEFKAGVRWQRIPERYVHMTGEELDSAIAEVRRQLGKRAVILGHHYQRDEIIRFADLRGDSFKLSQYAASQEEAEFIIFCGVHFMAETASVLCRPQQSVYLPNITAGCSMADMAPTDDVYDCYDELVEVVGEKGVVPVAYMNSTAAIKALCGRHGGIVCTSSSAPTAVKWAFQQGERVLFLPDQHLGRNTGLKLGIPLEQMVVWNPFKPMGGLTKEAIKQAKLILWKGHCSVHTRFTVAQIQKAREIYPDIKVIVHPECTMEVVKAADMNGSTEVIARTITSAPSGSKWAVGTEISLVNRLARENSDKLVFCLDPIVCPCSTMYRIHPAYLLWVMDELLAGRRVNQITVSPEVAYYARIALEKMLQAV